MDATEVGLFAAGISAGVAAALRVVDRLVPTARDGTRSDHEARQLKLMHDAVDALRGISQEQHAARIRAEHQAHVLDKMHDDLRSYITMRQAELPDVSRQRRA